MPTPQVDLGSLSLFEPEEEVHDKILPNPSTLPLRHDDLNEKSSIVSFHQPSASLNGAAKQSIAEQINQINQMHKSLNNDINKQF